jgi:DNA invertase Pin-like site-specific DNA recombinase
MLVGYMRVSSENERQSTDLQYDALIKAGVDQRNIFKDQASGVKIKRTGLEEALKFLREGDCLIVWKLDRLGRSLPHLIEIISQLKMRGIAFRSLTEATMDTTNAGGEFLFNIFASLAQYERALNQERIIAGLEAAKSRGRYGGRPRVINPEKIEEIQEALKAGKTKASICRNFGIKRSTLYDALNRLSLITDSSDKQTS